MLQLLASDFRQPGFINVEQLKFVSSPPFSNQKRSTLNRMMLNPSNEARSCYPEVPFSEMTSIK